MCWVLRVWFEDPFSAILDGASYRIGLMVVWICLKRLFVPVFRVQLVLNVLNWLLVPVFLVCVRLGHGF